MSSNDSVPPSAADLYKRLFEVAGDLNAVSDALGKPINVLDDALKNLNLGISTWIDLNRGEDPSSEYYWEEALGYAKVGNRWGIALRTEEGLYQDSEGAKSEIWLFSDAPRALRIRAVAKIPLLLQKLIDDAEKTARDLRAQVSRAQELAQAINKTASELYPPKKTSGGARR